VDMNQGPNSEWFNNRMEMIT